MTTFTCTRCHKQHPIEERQNFLGMSLCRRCLENETSVCDHCGERIWNNERIADGSIILCPTCYDEYYERCHACDCIMPNSRAVYLDDEDIAYCAECAEQRTYKEEGIHDYRYKPEPVFFGAGKRYMGVELEIDGAGENPGNADALTDIANRNNLHVYCKCDGSLDKGIEVVTHPMTLDYHMHCMPWERVMKYAVSLGYSSHQAGTCGLHVHVNRDSLGDNQQEQDDVIARILFFVENHWNELLRFSRRTQSQIEQWAARYGRKNSPKEMMDHVKGKYPSRYSCVNLLNEQTIEFRMFRGTLRYNTLIATLQLVNEICEVAFSSPDFVMEQLTWVEFVFRIDQQKYPELVQYLKERRLYVSEPVIGEEEV